ncbi:hypothetical protein M885DRAFT_572579 [Pelagophyceae sp. CCMP2097]|nr:hypothetical protein M885DRAFT_572579 [Pelagophyceae sp. CCMP2097]|mmetsp:Transcript_15094/g.50687  ORF Transcript_15094/g.50687 Transcript_15094/m.50687 type:complete len:269 (-) Transcript_15094:127-933(-)
MGSVEYNAPMWAKTTLIAAMSAAAGAADVLYLLRSHVFVATMTVNILFSGLTLAPNDVADAAGVFWSVGVYFLVLLANSLGACTYTVLKEMPHTAVLASLMCAGSLALSEMFWIWAVNSAPGASGMGAAPAEWVAAVFVSFNFGLQNSLTLDAPMKTNTSFHTGNFHKIAKVPYMYGKGAPRKSYEMLAPPVAGIVMTTVGGICGGALVATFGANSSFPFFFVALLQVVPLAMVDLFVVPDAGKKLQEDDPLLAARLPGAGPQNAAAI